MNKSSTSGFMKYRWQKSTNTLLKHSIPRYNTVQCSSPRGSLSMAEIVYLKSQIFLTEQRIEAKPRGGVIEQTTTIYRRSIQHVYAYAHAHYSCLLQNKYNAFWAGSQLPKTTICFTFPAARQFTVVIITMTSTNPATVILYMVHVPFLATEFLNVFRLHLNKKIIKNLFARHFRSPRTLIWIHIITDFEFILLLRFVN